LFPLLFYFAGSNLRPRFYVNLTTQATQWEFPVPPAQQPYPPPANYATPPPLQQSPPLQQPDAGAVPGDPQAEADKGIGKGSLLAAAGGLLAGAFVAHEVDEHNEHKSKFNLLNAGKLAGGGLLGSMGSRLPFGGGGNAYSAQSQGGGGVSSFMPFGGSNAPRLNIICAAFADQDVTQQVRRMVTPDQKFEISTDDLVKTFGDPWPGNRKQFSILYSYGQRPWELAATCEHCGQFSLVPHQPLDTNRMNFVKQGRVVAVVWGDGNGLTLGKGEVEKLKQIEMTGEFEATNDWMGFDGLRANWKTAIVYYRAGNEIRFAHARENGTVRMPWNPLAKWN